MLSLRNAYEALAVSAVAVTDGARGRLTQAQCDALLTRFASHVVENAGIELTIEGEMPPGRTFVVMSNHQSHYDVPVLYQALGGTLRMVAKTELFAIPLFGAALRRSGMIEIDRKNRQRAIASLAKAKEQIHGGTHVWIAPEGTRSENGELLPFKKGGFVLALDTESAILPITIQGTRDILPVHASRSARGVPVRLTIHAPVETKRFTERSALSRSDAKQARDELMSVVRAAIASAL